MNHTPEQDILLACLPPAPDRAHLAALLQQGSDWDRLIALAESHGLLPLLYATLKTSSDALPDAVFERLRNWFAGHALRALQMQQELRRLCGLFRAARIAVIPYKGPLLAEAVYGDLTLRSYVDLDLLVAPAQAQAALQLLLGQGYRPAWDLPLQRLAGLQQVDNHLLLQHPRQPWSVEVHWQLFHPIYRLPFDLDAHWAALAEGGEGRLSAAETLVMLCAHGTKHQWAQLKWLVDIDRLLRNGPPIAWPEALLLARRAKSRRSLLLGLNLARALCGTPVDAELAEQIAADAAVARLTSELLAGLFNHGGSQRREYARYLHSRDSWRDRCGQVLRWLCWPRQADWLAFPAGDRWHALYYVQRPLRMVWKWLVRPLWQGAARR